ncbi:MAG: glycosyltransferase family 39 protein [Acidobacteriota bacterium]
MPSGRRSSRPEPKHVAAARPPGDQALRRRDRATFVLQSIVCAGSAAFVAVYLFIALRRISYPFDLEWMEGAMVGHVWHVLAGRPIYGPPTLQFTAFLYPPLFYYVCAPVARLVGIGFFPLRLVSLVSSMVVFSLLYRIAARDTGSRYAGVVAVGMFAATYRIGGAWFDLARNDSLFLALLLGGVYLLRFRESRAGWASAGALLALSVLTKQTGAFVALPLLLYAAVLDWRRSLLLALAFGGLLGGVTLAYNLHDHGWFLYYVLRLPERIQQGAAEHARFWTRDILAALPIASALGLTTVLAARPWRSPRAAFWLLLSAGCVGAAWISRLHSGAYDNVLIPAYACLALLTGIALHRLSAAAAPRWQAFVRLAVASLCIVQLGWLHYPVSEQIPTARDAARARALGVKLAQADGEVLVPFHAFVPTPTGPVMHAHSWAIYDVLRGGDPARSARLEGDIAYAFDRRLYRMIVVDKVEPWMQPGLDAAYRRDGRALGDEELRTRTGYGTSPRWIFVPR